MLRFREDSLTQGLKTVEENAGENFASGGQDGDSTVVWNHKRILHANFYRNQTIVTGRTVVSLFNVLCSTY